MDAAAPKSKVTPFSLKDAPSLIERVWPAQKISVEAQKERKANLGQTLTGLGSYWKGRKPLVLVRACLLGALLPATTDVEKDLEIFEILMGMSDGQTDRRLKTLPTIEEIEEYGTLEERSALFDVAPAGVVAKRLPREERVRICAAIAARITYSDRVEKLYRPEEVISGLVDEIEMAKVNEHLSTTASSVEELIEQLGIMRFGRRPKVADTFSGGGSIPFEAARLGADVYASDLNPIACLLTWGAFNIIGASAERRKTLSKAEDRLIAKVVKDIDKSGTEKDEQGNQAKAYLYCMETTCPQTGWAVPMATSWVVSKSRNVVARLVADHEHKRFEIEIHSGVTDAEVHLADKGTIRDGRLHYVLDDQEYVTSIKSIRGDIVGTNRDGPNKLRRWSKADFAPRPDDIFRERLYCIQWISKESIGGSRLETYFAAPTKEDHKREMKVHQIVAANLARWQSEGLVPDMAIEAGDDTSRLGRERGWTHWHHLFTPRDYILISSVLRHLEMAEQLVAVPSLLNHASKLCQWITSSARRDQSGKQVGGPRELPNHVFYNQALNTFWHYASRASTFILRDLKLTDEVGHFRIRSRTSVSCHEASAVSDDNDIYLTDPPYADAVNYHEITEFFISWCRGRGVKLLPEWTWDSRRPLAIKGEGEGFKNSMTKAYRSMAQYMPSNGTQIVMFTHQNAGVWADMAQILWGAGLQVMAAWYISTETTSELKKGGYVQGTVILVLRKRRNDEHGYKDEIVQEVKVEVADQIDTMAGLNQSLKGHGRIENVFEDADLQMAGYAAALRVLTRYKTIDGVDMAKEATRPQARGERNLVGDVIEFAVQVANEHMVPEGMSAKTWQNLTGSERFYFKMMDVETTGAKKLDNYQNFAKAFRVGDYDALMESMEPTKAALKTAKEFKKAGFEGSEFGISNSRALLYAIYEVENDVDGDEVLSHLRDQTTDYFNVRDDLMALAEYVAAKRTSIDEEEARSAAILHGLIRNERFG